MSHAQESIGESHTGDRRRIVHLFSGFQIVLSVLDGPRQIIEYQLDGLETQTVSIVVGHDRDVGLDRMGQYIKSGHGSRLRRQVGREFRIDDRYRRGQRIIGERILLVVGLVGNDGERSDFTASSRSSRDTDEP